MSTEIYRNSVIQFHRVGDASYFIVDEYVKNI